MLLRTLQRMVLALMCVCLSLCVYAQAKTEEGEASPEKQLANAKAKHHMGSPNLVQQRNKHVAMAQHRQYYQAALKQKNSVHRQRLQHQMGAHRNKLAQQKQQFKQHQQHQNITFNKPIAQERIARRQSINDLFQQKHQPGLFRSNKLNTQTDKQAHYQQMHQQRVADQTNFGFQHRHDDWQQQRWQNHRARMQGSNNALEGHINQMSGNVSSGAGIQSGINPQKQQKRPRQVQANARGELQQRQLAVEKKNFAVQQQFRQEDSTKATAETERTTD